MESRLLGGDLVGGEMTVNPCGRWSHMEVLLYLSGLRSQSYMQPCLHAHYLLIFRQTIAFHISTFPGMVYPCWDAWLWDGF